MAGSAAAQGFGTNGATDSLLGGDQLGALGGDSSGLGADSGALGGFESCLAADGFGAVSDVNVETSVATSADQSVQLDEDTVLLSIALANNDIGDFSFGDVADRSVSVERDVSVSQDANVDREDVFSVLALGGNGGGAGSLGGDNGALACATDRDVQATVTATADSSVELDDDTVLLSIALSNNLGGDVGFSDVADIQSESLVESSIDSDVSVDRDDALLLLAFG